MPRILRQPELVWLAAVTVTVVLSTVVRAQVALLSIQLVVAAAATCAAFSWVRPPVDGRRPVLGISRALASSLLGSLLVFIWLTVPTLPTDTKRSPDLISAAVLIWFIHVALAAHLALVARAGWRLADDGWRALIVRSPELLWLTLTLLVMVTWRIGPVLRGWSAAWLMAIAPMAVVFACLVALVRTPAELRPRAALVRTIVSCFIGLTATTLLMTQSPTVGAMFRTEGAAFLWAFVLFWQCAITAVCGLLAWTVVREMMTLRTAIRVFVGGAAAIVLAFAAWAGISILSRDPIESMRGEQRARALSEAFGRASHQKPRAAWANGHETWNAFSVTFEPPDDVVVRVTTDYTSALAARPALAAGVIIPHTIANPEKVVEFWNAQPTTFAILKPFGIKSEAWEASWQAPPPDAPATLVWTLRRKASSSTREGFIEGCRQAELLHKGLLDVESAWGYWAELVEVWLQDPARFERKVTRDLRRAQISLLQIAADCGRPAEAACVNEVPALLALAETARSLEAEGVPRADAIRSRLTSPVFDLSEKEAAFSAAQRLYLYNLYQVVETSGVFNHPDRSPGPR